MNNQSIAEQIFNTNDLTFTHILNNYSIFDGYDFSNDENVFIFEDYSKLNWYRVNYNNCYVIKLNNNYRYLNYV